MRKSAYNKDRSRKGRDFFKRLVVVDLTLLNYVVNLDCSAFLDYSAAKNLRIRSRPRSNSVFDVA
jgi:hypothetical protein